MAAERSRQPPAGRVGRVDVLDLEADMPYSRLGRKVGRVFAERPGIR